MTVQELITQLQQCDPTYLVVMSKYGEGVGFSPVADADGENNVYIPDSTWSGRVRDVSDDPNGVRAVVLWSVN